VVREARTQDCGIGWQS